jgi:hypothetical protein
LLPFAGCRNFVGGCGGRLEEGTETGTGAGAGEAKLKILYKYIDINEMST